MGKITGNNLNLNEFISQYWRYYMDIENQTVSIRRYISFSQKNMKSFSIEMLKILQITCSEVDVFAKQIAIENSPENAIEERATISTWGPAVYSAFPSVDTVQIKVLNSNINLQPWKNWRYKFKEDNKAIYQEKCGSPKWWNAYNEVKHRRAFEDECGIFNYEKANLGNLLNSLGALYIIESLYLKKFDNQDLFHSDIFSPIHPAR